MGALSILNYKKYKNWGGCIIYSPRPTSHDRECLTKAYFVLQIDTL